MHCQCGCSPVLFPINALHDSKLWAENEEILLPKENSQTIQKTQNSARLHIDRLWQSLTVMARLGVLFAATPLLSIFRSRGHFALVKGLLCPAKQIGALVGSFWQNQSG